MMAAVALLVFAAVGAAMKTHEVSNVSAFKELFAAQKSMTCAEMNRARVDDLKGDLTQSNGFDAVFYKGCIKFVKTNGDGKHSAARQTEGLGSACKKGMFDGKNSALAKVDPSKLAAECDRAVNQMDMQMRLLGPDAFKSDEDFCAVFVDLVLPIDEEPECMRFVEDVSHEHSGFAGVAHHWPHIVYEKHFDEAFMRVCLEDKKLEKEEEGRDVQFGAGVEECRLTLERVMATNWTHYKRLSDFFAVACPVMGMPLPEPNEENFDPMASTKRSLTAQMFQRASRKVLAKHGNTSSTAKLFGKKKEPFSALQLMHDLDDLEGSVSAKSPRRRRLNTNQKVCCSSKAYNWEIGVSAGSTITVSGSVSLAAGGFNGWHGDTCYFKTSNIHEVCINWDFGVDMDGPFEIDASVAHGSFKSYGDMLGESSYIGANGCFIFCIGGSTIYNLQGQHIGHTVEFGLGFPGVDFEGGICTCAKNGNEQPRTYRNLKPNCPSGCFPSDATVDTPHGKKMMHELKVGDQVLAINDAGEPFFDEIYFFGHADHKAMSPMVQLQIQELDSNSSVQLNLSPDHFLHKCPLNSPCLWKDAEAAYSATILQDAYVWTASGSHLKLSRVLLTSMVPKEGLFNPYTLSGNIVVNGVAASAHSSWILDQLIPATLTKYVPALYQSIFVVGRWIYKIFGSHAADVIGVNNPQEHTPWSAYAVALSSIFVASCPFVGAVFLKSLSNKLKD